MNTARFSLLCLSIASLVTTGCSLLSGGGGIDHAEPIAGSDELGGG
jgi:hypothetical protein